MKKQSFLQHWKNTEWSPPEEEREELFQNFKIQLLKSIKEVTPEQWKVLFSLGNCLTKAGRHEEALEVDETLVQLREEDPICHYNLACSYSNVGKVEAALNALDTAFELGYWDLEHLQSDQDLENVRSDPRFYKLLMQHFGDELDSIDFV